MTLLNFLILTLISYRITQMIVYDVGPFDIFQKLRLWFGAYDFNSQGQLPVFGRFISCPHCVGFWVSLCVVLFGISEYNIINVLMLWVAIAGGQSFMWRLRQ